MTYKITDKKICLGRYFDSMKGNEVFCWETFEEEPQASNKSCSLTNFILGLKRLIVHPKQVLNIGTNDAREPIWPEDFETVLEALHEPYLVFGALSLQDVKNPLDFPVFGVYGQHQDEGTIESKFSCEMRDLVDLLNESIPGKFSLENIHFPLEEEFSFLSSYACVEMPARYRKIIEDLAIKIKQIKEGRHLMN